MAQLQQLGRSVIRVLNMEGIVVGTAFVVAEHLAVTCAHVVEAAKSGVDQALRIRFFQGEEEQTVQVLSEGWSPPTADDVAFLHLERLPEQVVPVILGSANQCVGHPYAAFGFARGAGYNSRPVKDEIDGLATFEGNRKHAMLQLKGEEIKQGLSGSPVLDLQTNRVVGMVSEFLDEKYTRLGMATTIETLLSLNASLKWWPDTYGPQELDVYLRSLIAANQWIKLPDRNEVLLERVYVSLRADQMNAAEWRAEHQLYLQDVEGVRREFETAIEADRYQEEDFFRKAIARHPKVLKLIARDWEQLFREHERASLSLAEVVQRHRQVVILGDPGSGKTTLGKWLVLQFARAMRQQADHVEVRAEQVHPGVQAETLFDLGPSRLPLLVRIADYAAVRWHGQHPRRDLSLEQYLLEYSPLDLFPGDLSAGAVRALLRAYLEQGRVLLILDGLDEVADLGQRRSVMQEVKHFLQGPQLTLTNQATEAWQENQVIVTSRIIGYQFDPLVDFPHYTVEEMDEPAMMAFCQAWMRHVAKLEPAQAVEQADQLKQALVEHAHPGVRTLAGNPLLLTLMAQVYWQGGQQRLPERRVALFEKVTRLFYDQREAFWDRPGITRLRLNRALAAVATFIHEHEPTGFIEKGQLRKVLRSVPFDEEQVEAVLQAAQEVSGFLVARGEGVYSFLHRSLQEYFVAFHLTRLPLEQMLSQLQAHMLDPLWQEPIILSIGLVSQSDHEESTHLEAVFNALLEATDPAGEALPRRELLATVSCAECERLPVGIGKRLASRLLAFYAGNEERRRSAVVQQRVRQAFRVLQRSPAASECEAVFAAAIQDEALSSRWAAGDVIIETEWDSPVLAQALVGAWQTFPGPAGTMLVALEKMQQRHPEYFQDMFLPLKRPETAMIWEQAKECQPWQAILRILYLPAGAALDAQWVNRDSPLTERILPAFRESSATAGLESFLQSVTSLTIQPETTLSRDATLALSALGDTSWVPNWVASIAEHEKHAHPFIATLYYFLSRDLDRDLDRDLARARDLDRDLARARDRDRDLARARDLGRDLARARARDLARALARVLSSLKSIEQELQSASLRWKEDMTMMQALDAALSSLHTLQQESVLWEPLAGVWSKLGEALFVPRSGLPESFMPTPELPRLSLSSEQLPVLINALTSLDDDRRQQARQVLQTQHQASTLGQSFIEQMAALSRYPETNTQVRTQLEWALHRVEYDKPEWIKAWIAQASQTQEETPAKTILENIHSINGETFETLVQELLQAPAWVKQAGLASLSWLVRLNKIPEPFSSSLHKQICNWFDQEMDQGVRGALVKVLGHWQEPDTAQQVGLALLDRFRGLSGEQEYSAIFEALARLAGKQPALLLPVRTLFLQRLSQASVAAALVRLYTGEVHKEEGEKPSGTQKQRQQRTAMVLLKRLREVFPDPSSLLAALLDAGIDDDEWEDTYHGLLASAVCQLLASHPDHADLRYTLITRLRQAIEQRSWPTRRIALAAVAACIEVMPTVMQNAAGGALEALLIKGTTDAESFTSRRFALTALSYLRTISAKVVEALLVGCQDIEIVQQDAIAAAGRFQEIEGDLLPGIVPYLLGESVSTAYGVIQLLAALATSLAGEKARLHEQIIEALVLAINDPKSRREVVISGEEKGTLEDALYTALLKVAGWTG